MGYFRNACIDCGDGKPRIGRYHNDGGWRCIKHGAEYERRRRDIGKP